MKSILNSQLDTGKVRADNSELRNQLSIREGEIASLEKRGKIIAREVVDILEKTKRE